MVTLPATENDALHPGICLLWIEVQISALLCVISDKQFNPSESLEHWSWGFGIWGTLCFMAKQRSGPEPWSEMAHVEVVSLAI